MRSVPIDCSAKSAKGAWAWSGWPSRRAPSAAGRAQGHQAGHGHRPGHRPVRGRAPGAGDDGPSRHRQGLRRRHDRQAGRPYFVMELVTRRCRSPTTATESTLPLPRAAGAVRPGLPRRVQHAHQKGDHPPRPQAVERPGRRFTTSTPVPKVIDFGIAKATGAAADRQDALHRVRRSRRHARVHEPRAGGADRARHRHAHRHLLAGRAALRAPDRHDAARP